MTSGFLQLESTIPMHMKKNQRLTQKSLIRMAAT
jgi:hypothetical protein